MVLMNWLRGRSVVWALIVAAGGTLRRFKMASESEEAGRMDEEGRCGAVAKELSVMLLDSTLATDGSQTILD